MPQFNVGCVIWQAWKADRQSKRDNVKFQNAYTFLALNLSSFQQKFEWLSYGETLIYSIRIKLKFGAFLILKSENVSPPWSETSARSKKNTDISIYIKSENYS